MRKWTNEDKEKVMDIKCDHAETIVNLMEMVYVLSAQPLAHRRIPPSPKKQNASHMRFQDNTCYWNKIKIVLYMYDRLDS